jgi:uncharacterized membrane protein YhaH (DUF805 family)
MDPTQLYLSFDGRIGRQPYWVGLLLLFCLHLVVTITTLLLRFAEVSPILRLGVQIIWPLLMLWVVLALQAKRLHDQNRSALWLLINLAPVLGWLTSFVLCGFLRGTEGSNRFGPDPQADIGAEPEPNPEPEPPSSEIEP